MQIKLTVWCSILPTGLAKTYKFMGKHTLLHFWLDHDLLPICGLNHLPLSFTTRKIHTLRPCISFWGIFSVGIKLLVYMHEHGFSLLWYSGKTKWKSNMKAWKQPKNSSIKRCYLWQIQYYEIFCIYFKVDPFHIMWCGQTCSSVISHVHNYKQWQQTFPYIKVCRCFCMNSGKGVEEYTPSQGVPISWK